MPTHPQPANRRPKTSFGHLPEGHRDRLPPQAQALASLVRTLTDVCAAHGYERVAPPLIEYEASLASGSSRERLRFTDPVSQMTLALRSDITGQVGRIAVTRLAGQARPLRLMYAGQVARVRGDQLSPERERTQAGAELIGSDSAGAAAEVLAVAVEALTATGLAGLSVDLTMPTLVADLAAAGWALGTASLAQVRAWLDGKDVGALRSAGAAQFVPLIAAAGPVQAALAALKLLDLPDAVLARLDAIAMLAGGLASGQADISVTLDPTERHGFEYQTWLGFSLFGAGLMAEVGRGGAYMVAHADGRQEAAIGFSLYVDGLVDLGLGQEARPRVLLPLGTMAAVGTSLREQGWITVAGLESGTTAAALNCSHVWANGAVAAA
ncbi:ATP phosphoribosyltransferase regulatory subunit [Sandarakinorhabdus sp.]|uniref:ATP phosphoribosyltransferase regulatory subunit n=1 Tax=Sandarakinorhabdus sp. TaxID=1916663 RepID=UPI00286D9F79|nr:ATP phosphoribosyltransferase regulatory subunit [Sandarakinorhabdus sp.]